MEYEQVEYCRRVVTGAILSQDINDYYNLLSPQVLLVTHFPYPSTSASSNMQAVQRWVRMSEPQHIAAVDAAATFAVSAATAADRGYANTNAKSKGKPTAVAPVGTTGAGGVRSQKRRVRELLRRQEQWRITQQQRYDTFRKRRDRHHRCAADGEDNGVGSADGSDGGGRVGAAVAAAASGRVTVDGCGAPAAPQPQQPQTSADKHLRAGSVGKSNSARCNAPNSGGSAIAALTVRFVDGVRWFQQQQQRQQAQAQTQPPQQRTGSGLLLSSNASTAAAPAGAAAAQTRPAPHSNPIPYEDAAVITEGKLLVSYRFFQLLHWVSFSDGKTAPPTHIAPIEVDIQLRKDILQEDEVLTPPPPPATAQEAYSQLGRQHTERNQALSCIRVVWGADYLLFADTIFLDDGLIVTIHRRMLTVPEVLARAAPGIPLSLQVSCNLAPGPGTQPQTRSSEKGGATSLPAGQGGPTYERGPDLSVARPEQVYHAVEAFYGLTATRIDACSNAWEHLDFSFVEAAEPSMLLRLTPVSGRVHISLPPRATSDPRLVQSIFLNQENDPTKPKQSPSNRTLIKARNKHGEEEAYEFRTQKNCLSFYEDGTSGGAGGSDANAFGVGGGAGAQQRSKNKNSSGDGAAGVTRYDASCVRVSGCHLQAKMDQLVPVLRHLVANCLLTLHSLDLSQNDISSLPDLRVLPLQSLKLHGNAIADWRVVEMQVAPLPYLSILTLHGNPIAEDTKIRAVAGRSGKAAVRDAHCKDPVDRAIREGRGDGDSGYWKRLLALLLRNPDRVAPLRQVDFVTLTSQDYHVAGAYEMFTTGQAGVLAKARSMMSNRTQMQPAGATM
ncbi:hypothetical protein, conserved [Leishmania shawi]|uniref:Leucine-rich repeat-containing protein 51 n=1 Tax=Leishmania shawi TaxID=5680 RepID=A0ABR3EDX0_9TRYP